MKRPGYMTIREASATYSVSRTKVHRLIGAGRLRATRDPRDERVTLIPVEDLEAQFRFPLQGATARHREGEDTMYETETTGRITAAKRARIDAIRKRIAVRGGVYESSVEIIRQDRERRTQQLVEAAALGRGHRQAPGERVE